MKVYNLGCDHDHHFEGWFSSEDDFSKQSSASQIQCPVCDSRAIRKLPAAPRLNLSGAQAPSVDGREKSLTHIKNLMSQVIAATEDVGERFAEEARRIHYNEAPARAIRGVASVRECAELVEEGIEVMPLSLPAASKQTLQ